MPHEDDRLLERNVRSLYSRAAVDPDSLSEEDRSVEVVASTEDIDRHGTIVRANWQLDGFRDNPIVLFAHNSWELPIGTASDVRVTDGKLRAKLTFSTKELSAKADEVWQNVKAKILKGVSVGFFPHTVTLERHEDRDVLVLDDNELFEISMCPVPSNPKALAEMRARAIGAADPPTPAPQPDPAPAPPAADPNPTPEQPENRTMSDPKTTDATPVVARALGLPAGSTEADIVAACSRLRELELQTLTITGMTSSGEAVGAVRALKVKADERDKLAEENTTLKAARDQQAFDTLVARGQTQPIKLSPAHAKLYQERFEKAKTEGRGAEIVADLEGYLKIASPIVPERQQLPRSNGETPSTNLTWNNKSFADLKPMQRSKLKNENPELYALMRKDWEASGSPAAATA